MPGKISQFVKTWKEIEQKDHKFYPIINSLKQVRGSQVNHFCVSNQFKASPMTSGICHGGAYPQNAYMEYPNILYWVNNYWHNYPKFQPFLRWITNPIDSPWRLTLHKSQVILDKNNHISSIMHKADCPAFPMINMGIGARLITEHLQYEPWFKLVNSGIHPALAYILVFYWTSDGRLIIPGGHRCFHSWQNISLKRFITGNPLITKETEGSYQEGKGNSRSNAIWNEGTNKENLQLWKDIGVEEKTLTSAYGTSYSQWCFPTPNWLEVQDKLFKKLELEPYDPKSSSYITGSGSPSDSPRA